MLGPDSIDRLSMFPNCPPLTEQPDISRREFNRAAILLAAGAAVTTMGFRGAAEVIDRVDTAVSQELWPDDELRIEVPEGQELVNKDGHLNLFFGGFGQKSVDTEGYFNSTGRQELTASVVYPNGTFTSEELADVVEAFLIKNNVLTVNIIGPSMGLPVGIKTFGILAERQQRGEYGKNTSASPPAMTPTVPVIDQLIGFSSPSDKDDARKGEIMSKVVSIAHGVKQPPELVWMWLYSYVDGPGDPRRGIDIRDPGQLKEHFELTWHQVLNGTSPKMALSQMMILDKFDTEEDTRKLETVIRKGKTQVLYTTPSNYDNTVDNEDAISSYDGVFAELDVLMHVLNTGMSGHANIEESYVALQKHYRSNNMFNGRNPAILY